MSKSKTAKRAVPIRAKAKPAPISTRRAPKNKGGRPSNESRRIAISQAAEVLKAAFHGAARKAGWYTDLETGKPKERNLAEMMSLEHSEISERLEGVRKNLMSDKIAGFTSEEEEMADLFIRAGDYCGYRKLRIGAAITAKMAYNATRADHKPENRKAANGKKF